MARRRVERIKPVSFDADISINNMERAVIYRMVDFNSFDTNDVIDWLFPSEAVRALRAAYPYASNLTHAGQSQVPVKVGDVGFMVWIDFNQVDCLHPIAPVAPPSVPLQETTKAPLLASTMLEIAGIVSEFDIVRSVITWFNANGVTPGFARHYFPALGSLLPRDHPTNLTSGKVFQDKPLTHEVSENIRKAPAIIAKGLFCDPTNHAHKDGSPLVRVKVGSGETITILTKVRA